MDKTDLIMQLDKQWQEKVAYLEHKLEQVRKCSINTILSTKCIQEAERNISVIENALVADATGKDKVINGSNEETRKAQRITFLADQRKTGQLVDMYSQLTEVQGLLAKSQEIFEETKDEIEIARMQVHHIDAMLRALGG